MDITVDIQIDKNGLKELKRNLKEFNKEIQVGVLDNPEEAKIAALQHFGGETVYSEGIHKGEPVTVPPRPFIAAPLENEKISKNIFEITFDRDSGELKKEEIKKTIDGIGYAAQETIKWVINNDMVDFGVRNSERTIETKGFDHPLLNTGKMRDSIKYEVVSK